MTRDHLRDHVEFARAKQSADVARAKAPVLGERADRATIRTWYHSRWWAAIRRAHLRREINCRLCAHRGRMTPAVAVDHVEPHRGRREWFFNTFNLQSLCTHCHNSIKKRMESGKSSGAALDGTPLHKSEGW
jgi:5-methylcytosine-specific restriction enzyme A